MQEESIMPQEETGVTFEAAHAQVRVVERLVGPAGLRPLPLHVWCRALIESGQARSALVAAAETRGGTGTPCCRRCRGWRLFRAGLDGVPGAGHNRARRTASRGAEPGGQADGG